MGLKLLSLEVWAFKLLHLLPEGRREKGDGQEVGIFVDTFSLSDAMHCEDGLNKRKCQTCDELSCVHHTLQVQAVKNRAVVIPG